jgi:hypothetical protein
MDEATFETSVLPAGVGQGHAGSIRRDEELHADAPGIVTVPGKLQAFGAITVAGISVVVWAGPRAFKHSSADRGLENAALGLLFAHGTRFERRPPFSEPFGKQAKSVLGWPVKVYASSYGCVFQCVSLGQSRRSGDTESARQHHWLRIRHARLQFDLSWCSGPPKPTPPRWLFGEHLVHLCQVNRQLLTLGGAGNTIAENFFNLRAERGLSNFDRRHSFTADYVWTSSFADGSGRLPTSGFMSSLLKAWTLSGSITLTSGTPLTAQVIGNQFDAAGTGVMTTRASATGLPLSTGTGFFNLEALTVPPIGGVGNAGRNTIPGSGLFSMNLLVQRTFRTGERKQFQIRLDSTNVTNHVNIVSVGTVVNALTYGVPAAAGGMRTLTSHLGFNF